MMLRSEQLQSESRHQVPVRAAHYSTRQDASSQVLTSASDIEALINRLIPEDISPNKRAVIEQLLKRSR